MITVPYGQLLANQQATGDDERYKFTGKERDEETGYDYFGARYYASGNLSWLSVGGINEIVVTGKGTTKLEVPIKAIDVKLPNANLNL